MDLHFPWHSQVFCILILVTMSLVPITHTEWIIAIRGRHRRWDLCHAPNRGYDLRNPKLLARPKPGSATTINWWILVGTAASPKNSNQTGFRFRKHVASVRSNPSYGSLGQECTSVSRSHECTSMKSQCYICWSNVGLLVKCPFCFTSLRLDLFSFILSRL